MFNVVAKRLDDDRDASFRRVFKTFYRPIFRFFEKRGFSIDVCHDLTQETFLRVYNGMEGFRGEAPFEAWLFQIAANTYRNALRHKDAQKRAGTHLSIVEADQRQEQSAGEIRSDALTDDAERDPLNNVLRNERLSILRESVSSLPEQMRRCVELRVYQDLSYQEIALLMRISVETVKAHLHQARKQLKTKIALVMPD